jgi:chemotaxis protein MotB
MRQQPPDAPKAGAPMWMVSFGDMMTLILTFFILLVSMSKEQQEGLLARGVGSFIVSTRSFGMPGMMGESERLKVFENVRVRFNLPPEPDPERRDNHRDASQLELIRADLAKALAPHNEISQPSVAVFSTDSSELTAEAKSYLDLLASTLRPAFGQLLLLEGHARDAGSAHQNDDRWLAYARALAVRTYLVESLSFAPKRVEARAWYDEFEGSSLGTRTVDARLVTPNRDTQD